MVDTREGSTEAPQKMESQKKPGASKLALYNELDTRPHYFS